MEGTRGEISTMERAQQLMWSRIAISNNTHFSSENLQILQPVLKVCLRRSFSLFAEALDC